MDPEPEPEPEPPSEAIADTELCGRWATLTGALGSNNAPVSYSEGASYDSVVLGPDSKDVEHNSVLLIPGLLSEAECAQLIEDVDLNGLEGAKQGGSGLERHRVLAEPGLSPSTAALFEDLLRDRLLPLISAEMPTVADYLWARSDVSVCGNDFMAPTEPRSPEVSLKVLPYRFASEEPAINRYTEGGEFGPHTDQQAITLNILLRVGCFEGGGTAFWAQTGKVALGPGAAATAVIPAPTLCLQPTAAGTVSYVAQI